MNQLLKVCVKHLAPERDIYQPSAEETTKFNLNAVSRKSPEYCHRCLKEIYIEESATLTFRYSFGIYYCLQDATFS